MSLLARMIDATASVFCNHEWSSRHEPDRWYLECVRCGATTGGIAVGREHAARAEAPSMHRHAALTVLKPSSRAAA
jgi:hypothetical protein